MSKKNSKSKKNTTVEAVEAVEGSITEVPVVPDIVNTVSDGVVVSSAVPAVADVPAVDLNCYRFGKYHKIFAQILRSTNANEQGGTLPITRSGIESFAIANLGMNLSKAKSSVNVLLSPRKNNDTSVDCRGNPSAKGHLYYFESTGKDNTGETQYSLFFRNPVLQALKRIELTPDQIIQKAQVRAAKIAVKNEEHKKAIEAKKIEREAKKIEREAKKALKGILGINPKMAISSEKREELAAQAAEIKAAKTKIMETRILEMDYQIKSLEVQIVTELKDSEKQGTAAERKEKKIAKLENVKKTRQHLIERLAKMNAPTVSAAEVNGETEKSETSETATPVNVENVVASAETITA